MRLDTKEKRDSLRNAIFTSRIEKGYEREDYKGLVILTKHEADIQKYVLEIYKGNSTSPIHNYYYRESQHAQMLERIQQAKDNFDRSEAWKAEQKEKNKGKASSHAAAAAAIKAELSQKYPHIKFSVKSSSFSMGSSVTVSWEDGCTTKEVEKIIGKYQYGHFNGMEDIYESSNRRDDIPQAKYVSTSRSMSAASSEILKPIAEKLFSTFEHEKPFNCWDANQFLYRLFYNTSFPANLKPVDIVRTGETCGISSPEVFYKISFPEQSGQEAKPQPELVEVTEGKVKVIKYSEKALAVVGDTYPIKDKLRELGGKFNKFLSCGPGWIFPATAVDKLREAFTNQPAEVTA